MKTLLILLTCLSCYAKELILVTGEWPPYTSKSAVNGGIITELVEKTLKHMGHTPKFVYLPWKRGESLVKSHHYLGTFPYDKTPTRTKNFLFSDKLFTNRSVFFALQENAKAPLTYKGLEALKGLRIGGIRGYAYVPAFKSAGIKLLLVNKDEQLIPLLASGRVELVVMDEAIGKAMIQKHYPNKQNTFKMLAKAYKEQGASYIMVSKTNPKAKVFLKAFNKSLAEILKK